jgi:hypothetical protein
MAKRFIDGQEVAAVGDFYTERFQTSAIGDLRTITVSKPGTYCILFEASFVGTQSSTARAGNADIFINDTLVARAYDQVSNTSTSSDYGGATCVHVATLEEGDVLKFITGQVGSASIHTAVNICQFFPVNSRLLAYWYN